MISRLPWTIWLRRIIYIIVLVGLVLFLIRQGAEPWWIMLANWPAFLAVIMVTSLGIFIQANAFKSCLPEENQNFSLHRLVYIWAISGISSLLAPLIAGLAMRTLLLQREGIRLKASILTTMRQTWFSCEYACFLGAIVLVLYPWPAMPWLGYVFGFAGFGSWLLRKSLLKYQISLIIHYFPSLLKAAYSPSWTAFFWLWGQLIAMAVNYWAAYLLMGAQLMWHECFLLAAITVLASIIVFIPNGLGILDALWLWVAHQKGMTLGESVALVLTMRFGYLTAAMLLSGGLSYVGWKTHRIDG